MKKKDLITLIQDTDCFIDPDVALEQYCTDAVSAVDIAYFAGVEFDDIEDKILVDFGAGTGRLTLASAFLNPKCIISVDIDKAALRILIKNVKKLDLTSPIHPICADLEYLPIWFQEKRDLFPITTIMNPPFGVQTRRADRVFLERAFSFSNVVYSLHLSGNENQKFIKHFVSKFGWKIDYSFPYVLLIEHLYEFHQLKSKKVMVDVYRFIRQ